MRTKSSFFMSSVVPGRVSVIIPCYNAANFIHRAIESSLNQTYKNVEVVVVDDASTDDLENALQPYLNNIVFYRNSINSGTCATRNIAVNHSTGELLAFLDQDDWWSEDLLEKLVPWVSSGNVVCYDNYLVTETEVRQTSGSSPRSNRTVFSEALPWKQEFLNRENMDIYFQGAPMLKAIVHRNDFDLVQGYDSRFFGAEDFHFFVKLLASDVHLKIVSEPKGYYLVHSNSTSSSISRAKEKELSSQLKACLSWLVMSQTMPNELDLTEKMISICRRAEKYWGARYADVLLRHHLRSKNFRGMINANFIQSVVPNLPRIVYIKAKNLASKLQTRLVLQK
jgi:glycosyltransferase involved in cell wall biosynthesis